MEALGATKYTKNFGTLKLNDPKNIQTYKQTILQYCSENPSIRLEGPPPHFTNIIFEMLITNQMTE